MKRETTNANEQDLGRPHEGADVELPESVVDRDAESGRQCEPDPGAQPASVALQRGAVGQEDRGLEPLADHGNEGEGSDGEGRAPRRPLRGRGLAQGLELAAVVDRVQVKLDRKRGDEPRADPRQASFKQRAERSQVVEKDPGEETQAQGNRESDPGRDAIGDVACRLQRRKEKREDERRLAPFTKRDHHLLNHEGRLLGWGSTATQSRAGYNCDRVSYAKA